ncbi:Spermine oxidase [Toxocara canis]|uniref:Spermine oxidase n=1 Tax=Toxocara canis TaxID=6265 RepID=A0A0B2V104_TOXCA|nr:Spermine oxidase [Toxocara canis]
MLWLSAIVSVLVDMVIGSNVFLRPNETSIAIIGAGFAGLSAARRLKELGFEDVTVYEGSDRIGGRVLYEKLGNGYIQHGAEYINGRSNPIYEIAEKLGIISQLVNDTDAISDDQYKTGKCRLNASLVDEFSRFVVPLEENYYKLAERNNTGNITVGQLYRSDYKNFVEGKKEDQKIFNALSRFYVSYYEGEWATRIDKFALRNLAQWDDYSGSNSGYSLKRDSFKEILDHISEGVPNEWIRLNSRVINIDYLGPKSRIQLTSGLVEKEFDYVIVTVSVGHLKKYARIMFTPPLPRKKREAIEKLGTFFGFGHMQKLFLVYEEPFWNHSQSVIVPLRIDGCSGTKSDKFTEKLHTFQPLSWNPNVLFGWLSGDAPVIAGILNDDEIAEQVTNHFREMFGNDSIPKPKRIMRKQWNNDDLFLGSYSYITPEAASLDTEVYARMAAPVTFRGRTKLLFAGEATHSRIYQTTVGAYLSGKREAERIARKRMKEVMDESTK